MFGASHRPRPAVPFHELITPPAVTPGDRVAVLSPSTALPALFPHVHELGLRRLREELGLEPVEYPTTRLLPSSSAATGRRRPRRLRRPVDQGGPDHHRG